MTKKNGVNICKNVFVDLIKKILIVVGIKYGVRSRRDPKNMNLFNVFFIVSKYYQGFVIFTTS